MAKTLPDYDRDALLTPVAETFALGLKAFGVHHKALAWHDAERMQRRFQIFAGLIAHMGADRPIAVNDHGCGYGAMFDAFRDLPALARGRYVGTDISPEMVATARRLHPDPRAEFHVSHVPVADADYSFVSGTYNMKMGADAEAWEAMVLDNLREVWARTRVCFGFNMLSARSPAYERTLHYFDPDTVLDFCRRELTANIRTVDRLEPREFVIFAFR